MTRDDIATILVGLAASVAVFFVFGIGALPVVLIAAIVANLWPQRRRCRCRGCCDCD